MIMNYSVHVYMSKWKSKQNNNLYPQREFYVYYQQIYV